MKLGRSEYGLMESLGWDHPKRKNMMVGGVLVLILVAQLLFAFLYRNGPSKKSTPPRVRARVEGVVITAAPLLRVPSPVSPAVASTIPAETAASIPSETAAPTTTEVELDYFKPTATVDLFADDSATSTGDAESTISLAADSAGDTTPTTPTADSAGDATPTAPTASTTPAVFVADAAPTSTVVTDGSRVVRRNSESGVAPLSIPVTVDPVFVKVPVMSELPPLTSRSPATPIAPTIASAPTSTSILATISVSPVGPPVR